MRSTCNWLKRHRLTTLTAGVALTALMLAPEAADAGRRWRSRRCCCGTFYGTTHHVGYGYNRGYAYSSGTWSNSHYAGQGYATPSSGYSYDSRAATDQNRRMTRQGEPQPQLAQTEQGQRITANRPDLESGETVPPAPEEATNNNQRTRDADDNRSADNQNRSADNQNQSAQVREMRQRIQNLEQENERLKQQLEEARNKNRNNSAPDASNRAQETNDTESNDTESGVSAEADADLPKPPDAEGNSNSKSK